MLAPPRIHDLPSSTPPTLLDLDNGVGPCALSSRSAPRSPSSPRSPLHLLQPRSRPPSQPPVLSTRTKAFRCEQLLPLPSSVPSSSGSSDQQPVVADYPSPSLPSTGSHSPPSPASPTTPPSAKMSAPLDVLPSQAAPVASHPASRSPSVSPRPPQPDLDRPPFSPVSDHRHSSVYVPHPHHHHHKSTSSGKVAPLPLGGDDFDAAKSISSIAVAAAGDTLRPTCLHETALSPNEYAAYVPALLSLCPAPSGLDGLYDELTAIEYLRSKCKIQLRDEALILALFERTPLGIKPGHFYAWLRLASWVQQGHSPSKELLFSQTIPAQTFVGVSSTTARAHTATSARATMLGSQGKYHDPPAGPSGRGDMTTKPLLQPQTQPQHGRHVSLPVTLGRSGRHAGVTATKLVKPKARKASRANVSLGLPPMPFMGSSSAAVSAGPGKVAEKVPDVPPPRLPKSTNPFHSPRPHLPPPPVAPPTTHIVDPTPLSALPPSWDRPHSRSHLHPYQHAADDRLRPMDQWDLPPPAMTMPMVPQAPAPSGKPDPSPLDVVIGSVQALNPFKQSHPRLVRPTPVVTTAPRPQAAPQLVFDPPPLPLHSQYRSSMRSEDDRSSRTGSPTALDDPRSGLHPNVYLGPGTTALSRAPISPLIQAGLDAASQAHRARPRPTRTYTTIQRSAAHAPTRPPMSRVVSSTKTAPAT